MRLKLFPLFALSISFNTLAELDQSILEQANKGDTESQLAIGKAYAQGIVVPKDHKEALSWYKKAAQQGDIKAQFELGVLLWIEGNNEEEKSQGMTLIHQAAEKNLAEAQFMVGSIYGIRKDINESYKWISRAAEQGDASALNMLGRYYEWGLGVPKNIPKAIEARKKSVDLGNPDAQVSLGEMYEQGRGVKRDYKKAAELYKLAADQGNGDGQANLGNLYNLGRGVVRDASEAIRLTRLSVAQKNDNGILILSALYSGNEGIKKSRALTYALIRRCGENCQATKRIELFNLTKIFTEQDVEIGKNLYEEMIKRDDVLSVVDEYEKTL